MEYVSAALQGEYEPLGQAVEAERSRSCQADR